MSVAKKVAEKVAGLFKSPQERGAEIERALHAVAADVERLGQERRTLVPQRAKGDPEAAQRIREIDEALEGLGRRRSELRDDLAEIKGEIEADERAAQQRAAADKARGEKALAVAYIERVRMIEDAAQALGTAIREAQSAGEALTRSLGGSHETVRKGEARFRLNLRIAFARIFAIAPKLPLGEGNNLLAMGAPAVGALSWKSLVELESEAVGLAAQPGGEAA